MLFFYGAVCAIGVAQAIAGYAELAGGKNLGYGIEVPGESDPEGRQKAHSVLASWGTLTAILSLPPLIPILDELSADPQAGMPTSVKILLTVYGIALMGAMWYPFIKIWRLSTTG
ncbi:hypothetical protein [Nocardia jiangsuensis]|uniref:Uncharacterized protein n=1 Tax=Nocardia jiangsuensis TaxID=1691563 RepID=A0ABV8E2F4_9NOCA